MITTKVASVGWINRILMLFVTLNIVGDVGNVIFWWVSPASRLSLLPSFVGNAAGVFGALIAGTVTLIVVTAIYIASLVGLAKQKLWAPLLVIAISVANRAMALVLYVFSVAFVFWLIWTIVLVVIAFLDWRKMKALAKTAPASASAVA